MIVKFAATTSQGYAHTDRPWAAYDGRRAEQEAAQAPKPCVLCRAPEEHDAHTLWNCPPGLYFLLRNFRTVDMYS